MKRSFGEIITFYSYKGGTGRSMALANVAYILATSGGTEQRRVLMIDWDLEAPGLQRFFDDNLRGRTLSVRPGLIDYFTDIASQYRDRAPGGGLPESMAQSDQAHNIFTELTDLFPLSNYIESVPGVNGLSILTAGHQYTDDGRLDTYWQKVRSFDWESFYVDYGSFFTHLRTLLMQTFDYILIDSRTGLTDIGGICTRVMPEKLVTVFAPNNQNIEGVLSVARRSIQYRTSSRDPRGLMVFPLASRIDASASRLRTAWWRGGDVRGASITGYQTLFENMLRESYKLDACDLNDYFDRTQIPHDSDYAYGEAVAAALDGTADRFGIGYACDQLAQRLVGVSAPWEPLEESGKPKEHGGLWISYRREDTEAWARKIYDLLVAHYGGDRVMMDIRSSPSGSEYATEVGRLAKNMAGMLALIGPGWLTVSDPAGSRLIQSESDFVRLEVSAALAQGVPVIPVLTPGAVMPNPSELPSGLEGLARRQAMRLAPDGGERDAHRLVDTLTPILGPGRHGEHRALAIVEVGCWGFLGVLLAVGMWGTLAVLAGGDGEWEGWGDLGLYWIGASILGFLPAVAAVWLKRRRDRRWWRRWWRAK